MDNSLKPKAEAIKNLVFRLECDLGFIIIINDLYNILKSNGFSDLANINAWRLNDYCIAVKSNTHLHKRCIHLRSILRKRLKQNNEPYELNCYLGVREYVFPININNTLVCTISATGYLGDISPKTALAVCHKLDMESDEFYTLRKTALNNSYNEDREKLKTYISILANMLKSYFEELPETAKYTDELNLKNQHLLKAIRYIQQNFTEPITVKDIADVCFVSPSYLQHIFSKYRGHGINEEITKERLQYAEALLTSTDRQIKDIAYSSGFPNSDYFCTVFKKYYGISPLKYRKIKLTNKSKPYK